MSRRFIILLSILSAGSALSYDCDELRPKALNADPKRFADCNCQAPNMSFLFGKLRDSMSLDAGVQELKEIVTEPVNYELRNEIKSSYRRLLYARRREKPPIIEKMTSDFDRMILQADVREDIQDFPRKGLTSKVSSFEGSIMISMSNFQKKDEMKFLPPEIAKKIGSSVHIRYFYPIDRFEYTLPYDGANFSLDEAFLRMQDEFEVACVARYNGNIDARRANKNERDQIYEAEKGTKVMKGSTVSDQ